SRSPRSCGWPCTTTNRLRPAQPRPSEREPTMPDRRAMNALRRAYEDALSELRLELWRHHYEPHTMDKLPDPATCPPNLSRAIRYLATVEERYQEASRVVPGWRHSP